MTRLQHDHLAVCSRSSFDNITSQNLRLQTTLDFMVLSVAYAKQL